VELVNQWSLEKSMAFYKDRFSDASDFTFVFVGDLDPAAMKPLAERYLASLPSTRRMETWKDIGVNRARGAIDRTVAKGIEPKSQVAIVFGGPFEWDQFRRIEMGAMVQVLQERLREAIREELGGTYTISASANPQRIPKGEYLLAVQFGCDPQRVDTLVKRVYQEIEKLKAEGPTAQETSNIKTQLLRSFETSSRQNAFVLGQLALRYQFNEDPAGVWTPPDHYAKLDAAGLQTAAKRYLDTTNRVQVTLMPEKK
jgi:zinc protease